MSVLVKLLSTKSVLNRSNRLDFLVYLAPNMAFSEMNYQSFNTSHELPVSFSKSFTNSMVHIHLTVSTLQHHSVPFSYIHVLSATTRGYQELSGTLSHIQHHSASLCILQLPPGPFSNNQGLPGTFWHSQPHSASFCILQLPPRTFSNNQGLPGTFWNSQPHSA